MKKPVQQQHSSNGVILGTAGAVNLALGALYLAGSHPLYALPALITATICGELLINPPRN